MTTGTDTILDVDLLAFEQGSDAQRRAVVDGVRRSLATGFVYTSHDLSRGPARPRLRHARGVLLAPGRDQGAAGSRRARTARPATPASSSRRPPPPTCPTGRRCSTGAARSRRPSPQAEVPAPLPRPGAPRGRRARHHRGAGELHDRVGKLLRRFLRIIALGLGADEALFESMTADAPDLTRAIHYPPMPLAPGEGHVWAGEHGDINLITALPRATTQGPPGEDRRGLGRRRPARGPRRHQHRDHARPHLQRGDPDRHPPGRRRPRRARATATRSCSSATPRPWTVLAPLASCVTPGQPPAPPRPSTPATSSTRSCGRSTSSRTAAGSTVSERCRRVARRGASSGDLSATS